MMQFRIFYVKNEVSHNSSNNTDDMYNMVKAIVIVVAASAA